MTKRIWVAVFALAVIAAAFGVWKHKAEMTPPGLPLKGEEASKPAVKIGVIAPLTGDNPQVGKNCRNGVEFAVKNLQDSPLQYKLVFEDSQFSAARAATVAHKLISADDVDLLIACDSPSGSAVAPIAEKAGKFMITVIASAPEVAVGHPLSFLHWTLPETEASLAAEMLRRNDVKKLVIFEQAHAGAKAIGDALRPVLDKAGIAHSTFISLASERNFGDIAAKAQAENPDGYMLLVLPPSLNMLVKRLNETDTRTKRFSIEVPTFAESPSLFEGVEFVDVYDGEPELMDAYRKEYATENVYGVAFAYDAAAMVDKVFSDFYKANGRLPIGSEIAAEMHGLKDWSGAVGPASIDSEGRVKSNAVVKKIVNGKAEVIR